MKTFFVSLRMFLVLTVLTGIVYPLFVYALGRVFFPAEIAGQLVEKEGTLIGSACIAQSFQKDIYFYSRPSASDYATVPSGASNVSPTSQQFKDAVEKRRTALGDQAPVDLLTASGSGLDPDLSPAAIHFQIDRVAKARHLNENQKQNLEELIHKHIQVPQFGVLGRPRINVFLLNKEMDALFPL